MLYDEILTMQFKLYIMLVQRYKHFFLPRIMLCVVVRTLTTYD